MKPATHMPVYQSLVGLECVCGFPGCGRKFKRLRSSSRDDCKVYCSTTCANNDKQKETRRGR